MTLVTNVVKGLNPSDSTLSPYKWLCPEVEPNSAIYFYQFSFEPSGSDSSTWTTRFTIAKRDGSTEPPENASQSEGEAIPWGNGHIESSPSSDKIETAYSSSLPSPSASSADEEPTSTSFLANPTGMVTIPLPSGFEPKTSIDLGSAKSAHGRHRGHASQTKTASATSSPKKTSALPNASVIPPVARSVANKSTSRKLPGTSGRMGALLCAVMVAFP